jgi:hypothetical protein
VNSPPQLDIQVAFPEEEENLPLTAVVSLSPKPMAIKIHAMGGQKRHTQSLVGPWGLLPHW